MLMTPGTEPCTRADAERLFEVAAEPVEVGAVDRIEALVADGQPR
jgi:6-phosphofructokinase 2